MGGSGIYDPPPSSPGVGVGSARLSSQGVSAVPDRLPDERVSM
jgi:hypothetical protein